MATAILSRSDRAAGIVQRHECELQDNGTWHVRDTKTGSGEIHVTTTSTCDCWDYRRRGSVCKHIAAVIVQERALHAYALGWDQAAEQARASVTGPRCPTCGGPTDSIMYYVGGRGYLYYVGGRGYCTFALCTVDSNHAPRRLS
jgi:hypothetical protein